MSAATPSTPNQQSPTYFIERFYSLVAGASEDRIVVALREDLRKDALSAAYTVEAWLEEINGREEKYDRLANLARSVAPISDLLRTLTTGVFTGCYADLVRSYEDKNVRLILAQRYEMQQSASEVEEDEQLPIIDDLLSALQNVVNQPNGRDDYVAWFQIGWLQWKQGVLDEAETAFRTAASFSQRHSSWYHAQSLRHEAYIQWLRENGERARATVRRALEVRRDPTILIEAARYAICCDQSLESQTYVDEALHADPLIFVSVLADPAFAPAVTATVDILVRQQTRSAETAKTERQRWEDVLLTIRVAEKQGSIKLLPEDADEIFASASLGSEIDFPTAIYRTEQAKATRQEWVHRALETLKADVAHKKEELDSASELLRNSKLQFNNSIDNADSEQRLAEIAVQEEHGAVKLPVVPELRDEMLHGLILGIIILVTGCALLAGLSQWKFGSVPPLQPISTLDWIIVSPVLLVVTVFGLFGILTFPMLRIGAASRKFNAAASHADEIAEHKLRAIANEGTRKRDAIKHEWAGLELDLHARMNEAQRLLRASTLALSTVKQISS